MEELKFLSSNKVSTPPTYVAQFGLYVDEQSLIRCAGRIKNAHLPNSSKYLVLLPKNHHFTNLVIQEVHHRTSHSGINQSLSSLREQFWIIRGREQPRTQDLSLGKTLAAAGHVPHQKFSA